MRIAILASGSGSNAQAIMEAADRGDLGGTVVVCLSDRPGAGVLERAARFGVPTAVVDDPADGARLLRLLDDHGAEAVVLAGYLRRITGDVVRRFKNRMLNIHPALLPAFGGKGMYGMHVHRAVLESGVRWTGATVHLVDEEYDTGPIVLQSPVPVMQDDSPETLASRVLELEHHLYPLAVRLLAQQRLTVVGRRVVIDEAPC
ncbi:MAG: phosphoribosylglycinamide formyltransferase [Bacteroidota bacterium]